jgi:hypothetical protein
MKVILCIFMMSFSSCAPFSLGTRNVYPDTKYLIVVASENEILISPNEALKKRNFSDLTLLLFEVRNGAMRKLESSVEISEITKGIPKLKLRIDSGRWMHRQYLVKVFDDGEIVTSYPLNFGYELTTPLDY